MLQHFSFIFCLLLAYSCKTVGQLCRLNAQYKESARSVVLDWNMTSHTAKTTFILLRSTDEKVWNEIVTENLFQYYTKEDIFDYEDKISRDQKYFYRLKIIGSDYRTITFSNTAAISTEREKSSWIIYPNPVNDVLHLVCQGNNITGVINLTVQDITGKIVIRFRAASIYKKLQIPVLALRKDVYLVQISIMNEIVMSRKFIKQ